MYFLLNWSFFRGHSFVFGRVSFLCGGVLVAFMLHLSWPTWVPSWRSFSKFFGERCGCFCLRNRTNRTYGLRTPKKTWVFNNFNSSITTYLVRGPLVSGPIQFLMDSVDPSTLGESFQGPRSLQESCWSIATSAFFQPVDNQTPRGQNHI